MGSQKPASGFTGTKSFLCWAVNHTIYRVGVSDKPASAFTGPKSFLCWAVNHTIYRVGVSDKPALAAPTQMTGPRT